ncbi:hypothetical protein ACA910_020496 [Epithemia clementina (nom. ined.)]
MITEKVWTTHWATGFVIRAICNGKCQVWIEVDGGFIAYKNQKHIQNGTMVTAFEAHGHQFHIKLSLNGGSLAFWNGSARYLVLYMFDDEENKWIEIDPKEQYHVQAHQYWKVKWNYRLHVVRAICAKGKIRVLVDGSEITTPQTRHTAQHNAVTTIENFHDHLIEVKLSARGLVGSSKNFALRVDGEEVQAPRRNPLSPQAPNDFQETPPQTFFQILMDVSTGTISCSVEELLDKLSERVVHIQELKLVYTATNTSFKQGWIDEDKRRRTVLRVFERAASEDFHYDEKSQVSTLLALALKKAHGDGIITERQKMELEREFSKWNMFADKKFRTMEEMLVLHGKQISALKSRMEKMEHQNQLKTTSRLLVGSLCALIPIFGGAVGTVAAELASFCLEQGTATEALAKCLDEVVDFSDPEHVKNAIPDHLLEETWKDQKIIDVTNMYLTDLGRPAPCAVLHLSHLMNNSSRRLLIEDASVAPTETETCDSLPFIVSNNVSQTSPPSILDPTPESPERSSASGLDSLKSFASFSPQSVMDSLQFPQALDSLEFPVASQQSISHRPERWPVHHDASCDSASRRLLYAAQIY